MNGLPRAQPASHQQEKENCQWKFQSVAHNRTVSEPERH
jgi:hypothetical protein